MELTNQESDDLILAVINSHGGTMTGGRLVKTMRLLVTTFETYEDAISRPLYSKLIDGEVIAKLSASERILMFSAAPAHPLEACRGSETAQPS